MMRGKRAGTVGIESEARHEEEQQFAKVCRQLIKNKVSSIGRTIEQRYPGSRLYALSHATQERYRDLPKESGTDNEGRKSSFVYLANQRLFYVMNKDDLSFPALQRDNNQIAYLREWRTMLDLIYDRHKWHDLEEKFSIGIFLLLGTTYVTNTFVEKVITFENMPV